MLESVTKKKKKKKKKYITDIDQSLKSRRMIIEKVIKIKTMILCICITLLIVTFSVIILSNYQIVI